MFFKAGLDVSAIHLAVAVEIKQPDFQLLGERHGAEQRDDGARREQQLERIHVRLASAGDDRGIVVWAQAVEDDTDEVERLRAGLGCVRPCAVRVVAVEEPGHRDLSSGAHKNTTTNTTYNGVRKRIWELLFHDEIPG
jgi:hypothetical protein